jgi:hypothetical protein
MLHRTCVFASGGICCHIVDSITSGERNADTQFFLLGWARCGLNKKRAGTHYVKLVFSQQMGSAGRVM